MAIANTLVSAGQEAPVYRVIDAESVAAAGNVVSLPLAVEGFAQCSVGVNSNSANYRRNLQASHDGATWYNLSDQSNFNSSGGAYYATVVGIAGFAWLRLSLTNSDATAKNFTGWIGLSKS